MAAFEEGQVTFRVTSTTTLTSFVTSTTTYRSTPSLSVNSKPAVIAVSQYSDYPAIDWPLAFRGIVLGLLCVALLELLWYMYNAVAANYQKEITPDPQTQQYAGKSTSHEVIKPGQLKKGPLQPAPITLTPPKWMTDKNPVEPKLDSRKTGTESIVKYANPLSKELEQIKSGLKQQESRILQLEKGQTDLDRRFRQLQQEKYKLLEACGALPPGSKAARTIAMSRPINLLAPDTAISEMNKSHTVVVTDLKYKLKISKAEIRALCEQNSKLREELLFQVPETPVTTQSVDRGSSPFHKIATSNYLPPSVQSSEESLSSEDLDQGLREERASDTNEQGHFSSKSPEDDICLTKQNRNDTELNHNSHDSQHEANDICRDRNHGNDAEDEGREENEDDGDDSDIESDDDNDDNNDSGGNGHITIVERPSCEQVFPQQNFCRYINPGDEESGDSSPDTTIYDPRVEESENLLPARAEEDSAPELREIEQRVRDFRIREDNIAFGEATTDIVQHLPAQAPSPTHPPAERRVRFADPQELNDQWPDSIPTNDQDNLVVPSSNTSHHEQTSQPTFDALLQEYSQFGSAQPSVDVDTVQNWPQTTLNDSGLPGISQPVSGDYVVADIANTVADQHHVGSDPPPEESNVVPESPFPALDEYDEDEFMLENDETEEFYMYTDEELFEGIDDEPPALLTGSNTEAPGLLNSNVEAYDPGTYEQAQAFVDTFDSSGLGSEGVNQNEHMDTSSHPEETPAVVLEGEDAMQWRESSEASIEQSYPPQESPLAADEAMVDAENDHPEISTTDLAFAIPEERRIDPFTPQRASQEQPSILAGILASVRSTPTNDSLRARSGNDSGPFPSQSAPSTTSPTSSGGIASSVKFRRSENRNRSYSPQDNLRYNNPYPGSQGVPVTLQNQGTVVQRDLDSKYQSPSAGNVSLGKFSFPLPPPRQNTGPTSQELGGPYRHSTFTPAPSTSIAPSNQLAIPRMGLLTEADRTLRPVPPPFRPTPQHTSRPMARPHGLRPHTPQSLPGSASQPLPQPTPRRILQLSHNHIFARPQPSSTILSNTLAMAGGADLDQPQSQRARDGITGYTDEGLGEGESCLSRIKTPPSDAILPPPLPNILGDMSDEYDSGSDSDRPARGERRFQHQRRWVIEDDNDG